MNYTHHLRNDTYKLNNLSHFAYAGVFHAQQLDMHRKMCSYSLLHYAICSMSQAKSESRGSPPSEDASHGA
jgi:hypothetical protein